MSVHVKAATVSAPRDLVSTVEQVIAGIEAGGGEVLSVSHAIVNSATTSVLVTYRKP